MFTFSGRANDIFTVQFLAVIFESVVSQNIVFYRLVPFRFAKYINLAQEIMRVTHNLINLFHITPSSRVENV